MTARRILVGILATAAVVMAGQRDAKPAEAPMDPGCRADEVYAVVVNTGPADGPIWECVNAEEYVGEYYQGLEVGG